MPPPKKSWGCKRCCYIWFKTQPGLQVIGCAHCRKISQRIVNPVGGEELLARQVERSHAGHQKICGRPIR